MRRLPAALAVLAIGVLAPSTSTALAGTHRAVSIVAPGDMVPAEIVQFQLSGMRADVQRFREAFEAGRLGEPADDDGARFDAIEQRIDELASRATPVAFDEMGALVVDTATFLLELAARPGADPLVADQINAMFLGAPISASGPTAAVAPPTAAPTTPAPTTVTTTPATGAPTNRAPTTAVPATAAPATAAPVTAPSTIVVSAPLPEPAEPGWSFRTWLLVAIALAAAFAIAAYAGQQWYRSRLPRPTGRPGFHDLLDVSRRLAGAGSVAEVEQMAVRQAMRLIEADAAAFVRHTDRLLTVGHETVDGLLVGDRIRDGVIDRVIGTGNELMQVSSTEPSIRQLPVSLIAAPVLVSGAVTGAIVLVRAADRPFTDLDLRMIRDLKPIVGAAMEQVHHTDRFRAEALTDGLTGVGNRRSLDLAVGDLGGAPFAAVMVDLDHFKAVNDTFGHHAGDELLRAVAQRLVANVRPGDRVYRYGGEEFAIVLPHTDEAAAAEVAERVRAALEAAPFHLGPARTEHRATASLGVAAGTADAAPFARADAALYDAKSSGRNRVSVASVAAPR